MTSIPPTLDTDPEDVVWALQTAEALWKRNEHADAIVWLRRAARAASDAENDDRALALAREAADLAEGVPNVPNESLAPPAPPSSSPLPVPSAAEAHAGILDPWADDEAPTMGRDPGSDRPAAIVDLSAVEGLGDLPDDAREAFARAATIRILACDDEVNGFALALVLEGSVEVAATLIDAPALQLQAGAVMRARGTIEHVVPVRLVVESMTARVATWDDRAVEQAFRDCPWVEDELRAAGDRPQALVGATMGLLGERLDAAMRAEVTSKLNVRALAEHEIVASRGEPVSGLLVVGAGELEVLREDGSPTGTGLRPGAVVFPSGVLRAAPAPNTVRAGKGGALILAADRAAAQELLMTCPPLLELLSVM